MMEPEFEINGNDNYNTDDEEDDAFYYANNGESKCIVCMGGSYIHTINIKSINYDNYEDYDDNDFNKIEEIEDEIAKKIIERDNKIDSILKNKK